MRNIWCDMSKVEDVFKGFDTWMKRYDHRDDSNSMSFRHYITCGPDLIDNGVTYDEYIALALMAKDHGYLIEWVVPYETYNLAIAQVRIEHAMLALDRL